jgi:hypothetical protein
MLYVCILAGLVLSGRARAAAIARGATVVVIVTLASPVSQRVQSRVLDHALQTFNDEMKQVASEKLADYMALVHRFDDVMCEAQPIFNTEDPPLLSWRMIRLFGVDYLLVPPEWRAVADGLLASGVRLEAGAAPPAVLTVGEWRIVEVRSQGARRGDPTR